MVDLESEVDQPIGSRELAQSNPYFRPFAQATSSALFNRPCVSMIASYGCDPTRRRNCPISRQVCPEKSSARQRRSATGRTSPTPPCKRAIGTKDSSTTQSTVISSRARRISLTTGRLCTTSPSDDGRRTATLHLKVEPTNEVTGFYYSGTDGRKYEVSGKIGNVPHAIRFQVMFPKATQTFSAMLFTADGRVMTGTSILQGRETGFYAVRQDE